MKKQFSPPENKPFGLRASNIGKPLCQLQFEKKMVNDKLNNPNFPKAHREYNHILRMVIGDVTEIVLTIIIAVSGINVTGGKNKVSLLVNGSTINGENDIEIDGQVWDIKSASPYSFQHKWDEGWEGIYYTDTFGYVEQLYTYAKGDPEKMGGWIVVDKSSGEVRVVKAEPTDEQLKAIKARIERVEDVINTNKPFQREFTPEPETFYKKETGREVLKQVCGFCPYVKQCWPEAKLLPKLSSKSDNAPLTWYTKLNEDDKEKI